MHASGTAGDENERPSKKGRGAVSVKEERKEPSSKRHRGAARVHADHTEEAGDEDEAEDQENVRPPPAKRGGKGKAGRAPQPFADETNSMEEGEAARLREAAQAEGGGAAEVRKRRGGVFASFFKVDPLPTLLLAVHLMPWPPALPAHPPVCPPVARLPACLFPRPPARLSACPAECPSACSSSSVSV